MKKSKVIIAIVIILFLIVAIVGYFVFWQKGKSGEDSMAVKVYFNNSKLDPEFSCNKVFPVDREIVKTKAVATAALEELLKGPTEDEKLRDFLPVSIPELKSRNWRLKIKRSVLILISN